MRVLRLDLSHFRGFDSIQILPAEHVCLVGEPGAGRSDLIDGLVRVLSTDFTRTRTPTELDFYKRDTSRRAEVEVVLGCLGNDLEQVFFDHLEVWDPRKRQLVEELAEPELIDRDRYELVVRLCYRASWNSEEDQADHWIDYPKTSDPDAGLLDRVVRTERQALRFAAIDERARLLDLATTGTFRKIIESMDGDDFPKAMRDLEAQIDEFATEFSGTVQMKAALERLLSPLRIALGLPDTPPSDVIRFLPEGGSITGLMRSLAPAIDLQDGEGSLPLHRHGSTLAAMFRVAQALAKAGNGGIVVIDDFGEELDAASSQHLAATLRQSTSQVWLSTRRSHAADAFPTNELIRLARDGMGTRRAYHARRPETRQERLAARHLNLQLLPAIASRSVVILEGPHDRAALAALASRLHEEKGIPLPAARGITLTDAGSAGGSGGSSALPRLAVAARELGWLTVAVLDYDNSGAQAEAELKNVLSCADAVIRLPPGHAVEFALLVGLGDEVIRTTLIELQGPFSVVLPANLNSLSGSKLRKEAREVLKRPPGLHAQFIEALPGGVFPPLAEQILQKIAEAGEGRSRGHIQL